MGCMAFLLHHLRHMLQEEQTVRLKEIRTEKGLSVPKLVELSGVPRRTIQDLEARGDGRVSTAIKLADALGVTLDELCRDEAAE
jgi:transcriptional regulator with XRE-family HTH domain